MDRPSPAGTSLERAFLVRQHRNRAIERLRTECSKRFARLRERPGGHHPCRRGGRRPRARDRNLESVTTYCRLTAIGGVLRRAGTGRERASSSVSIPNCLSSWWPQRDLIEHTEFKCAISLPAEVARPTPLRRDESSPRRRHPRRLRDAHLLDGLLARHVEAKSAPSTCEGLTSPRGSGGLSADGESGRRPSTPQSRGADHQPIRCLITSE